MVEQDKCIKEFMSELNAIMAAICSKNPKDDQIQRMRNRYMLIKNSIQADIISLGAEFLWKYRVHIVKSVHEAGYFLNLDFKEEYQRVAETHLPPADAFEEFPVLIEKMKMTWLSFTPAEQATLWSRVQNMLKHSASYTSNKRAISQIK